MLIKVVLNCKNETSYSFLTKKKQQQQQKTHCLSLHNPLVFMYMYVYIVTSAHKINLINSEKVRESENH